MCTACGVVLNSVHGLRFRVGRLHCHDETCQQCDAGASEVDKTASCSLVNTDCHYCRTSTACDRCPHGHRICSVMMSLLCSMSEIHNLPAVCKHSVGFKWQVFTRAPTAQHMSHNATGAAAFATACFLSANAQGDTAVCAGAVPARPDCRLGPARPRATH